MKNIFQYLLIFALILSLFPYFSLPALAETDEAGTSSAGLDEITQNVKKRIQDVINEQLNERAQAVVYGRLNSITTNTLSIAYDNRVQLASTSAETSFVRIPGNTKLNLEDLAIDEYVIAVGPSSENEVINASKVISQKNPPASSTQQSYYGNIYTYDSKLFKITVENPQSGKMQDFQVGRKTNLYLGNPDGTKTKIDRKQSLPIQSQVLILHEAPADPGIEPLIQEILIIPSSPIVTPAELKP